VIIIVFMVDKSFHLSACWCGRLQPGVFYKAFLEDRLHWVVSRVIQCH